jgi:hypothetical protein
MGSVLIADYLFSMVNVYWEEIIFPIADQMTIHTRANASILMR